MSSNLQPCRMSQRMAKAAVQGMRAPAAVVAEQIVAKRQVIGHIPAGGNDPMEVPDF